MKMIRFLEIWNNIINSYTMELSRYFQSKLMRLINNYWIIVEKSIKSYVK